MWMTGFDVPSCSTIYLDRPMRNHTLMQTIAHANRVFPDKENGLIVDDVGVFRHLVATLAVYASGPQGSDGSDIIRERSELVGELDGALIELREFSERWDVALVALARAEGDEFIAVRDASVDALLVDLETRRRDLSRSDRVQRLFSAILPDPAAAGQSRVVGVARNSAGRIRSLDEPPEVSAVDNAARRNPARLDLVERLRSLIDAYNAGSLNVDEMLRRAQLPRGNSPRRSSGQFMRARPNPNLRCTTCSLGPIRCSPMPSRSRSRRSPANC